MECAVSRLLSRPSAAVFKLRNIKLCRRLSEEITMASVATQCIPPEVLAEKYFLLMQDMISKLQHHFRESGLTQKQIAARVGKQPAVVSRCLAGQENITTRTLHDLARGMDCRWEFDLVPLSTLQPSNRPIPDRPNENRNIQVRVEIIGSSGLPTTSPTASSSAPLKTIVVNKSVKPKRG